MNRPAQGVNGAQHRKDRTRRPADEPLPALFRWAQSVEKCLQPTEKRLQVVKKSLQSVEKRLQSTEKRLQSVKKRLQSTEKRLQSVKKRPQPTEKRLQVVKKSLQSVKKRLQSVEKSLHEAKKILFGSMQRLGRRMSRLFGGRVVLDDCMYFNDSYGADARKLWVKDIQSANGFTSTGQTHTYWLYTGPSTTENIKIVLSYTDYPGAVPTGNPMVISLTPRRGDYSHFNFKWRENVGEKISKKMPRWVLAL